MDDLKYPIGRMQRPVQYTPDLLSALIEQVASAPALVRQAVAGLGVDQLNTPYREGGWTVAQVVHHLPDSHMNAYVRFKLALTEDAPLVCDYSENAWADLPDGQSASAVAVSLDLLQALHGRFVATMRDMSPADWSRIYVHPTHGSRTLDVTLSIYAWHGRHHAAHITRLRDRQGW